MAQLAAKKYANALFELYKEANKEDKKQIYDEASMVYGILTEEAVLREMLLNPRITSDQKAEMLSKAFGGFSHTMTGFLDIVIKKNRENELLHMLRIFLELAEEHMGRLFACVYAASPLTEKQIKKISEKLSQKTKKTVTIEVKVDKSLIGGLRILAGGFIFDTTVKKQLEDMRLGLLG